MKANYLVTILTKGNEKIKVIVKARTKAHAVEQVKDAGLTIKEGFTVLNVTELGMVSGFFANMFYGQLAA